MAPSVGVHDTGRLQRHTLVQQFEAAKTDLAGRGRATRFKGAHPITKSRSARTSEVNAKGHCGVGANQTAVHDADRRTTGVMRGTGPCRGWDRRSKVTLRHPDLAVWINTITCVQESGCEQTGHRETIGVGLCWGGRKCRPGGT